MKIPQTLINFRVYLEGDDLLGIADVDLPDLEAVSAEVKGAGIAGVIDAPIQGHYNAMTLTLNWRSATGPLTQLAAPKAHQIDLRGSVQAYDSETGEYESQALKVLVKAIPKKTGLGKFDAGEAMGSSAEFEVIYIKISSGDEEWIEIDKINYKCVIDGTDYLEQVRTDLGL